MLSSEAWWEVIANYNKSIFPLQWIGLLVLVSLGLYLVAGNNQRANILIKLSLLTMNFFIGIRFFIMSEGFPLPLRVSQGVLFISIGILFAIDLFRNRVRFQFPKARNKRLFFIIGGLFMIIYPFVGAILGRDFYYWIMPGSLPCPTTAFTLLLIITAKERANKLLVLLLLIWAIPFPPLVQLPKYQVYEDSIMFVFGLITLVVFIKDIYKRNHIQKASSEMLNVEI